MLPNAFFTAIVVPLVFAIRTQSDGQILANEMTLNWPTLAFHFEIKRSSMAIHGYANFSVLAFPVLSRTYKGIDSIMYDTVATFTEGSTLSRYMVVEGKAYASHVSLRDNGLNAGVECDDTGVTPPINAIINAINQAEPVSSNSSNSSGTIKCSSETTLKISIDGVELGLCFAESSGFTLYGSDMTITVKYLKKHERRYKQITKANGTCETVASPASVTTIGRSLLTGKRTLRDSRKLRAFLANFNFSARHHKCSCKSTIRPCVFIHGLRLAKVLGEFNGSFSMLFFQDFCHPIDNGHRVDRRCIEMVAAFAFWIVATIIVQAELTTATLQDHGSMENAATTSWPSLRVHFSVKRSSRKLHGQSEFMIVADPVVSIDDSTRVLYNTFGTLTENSTVFSYTLVNGVSYVSTSDVDGSAPPTVKCSTSNYLPSVNSLFAGLSDAIKVSGLPPSIGNAEKCSNADSVTVSIEGAIFRLCYSSSEGFSMFGSDMDVKVNYVRSSFAIKAPALRANSNLCEAVTSSYSVTFWGHTYASPELNQAYKDAQEVYRTHCGHHHVSRT
ncbi:hypothetical protein CCR75_009266 [Bremia lactucae]|uniref:Uncharacterized protein n=1 Tax=Bremia lactucae TaxID=4779 RepID=A0A976IHM9_BRELC|nr:hypothetical protein CCR75_009266 [Bremia lactucae]